MTVHQLTTVGTFKNLYAWIDAIDSAEHLTVAAGYEVLDAYESGVWHADIDAEWQRYFEDHGYQPQWSKRSSRTFYRWLQNQAEADGHPMHQSQSFFRHLHNAATMHRYVTGASTELRTMVRTLPTDERSWRPFTRLLTGGGNHRADDAPVFGPELVEAVELAVQIAEDEGKSEFTSGVASKARSEVWRTAPRIRAWVEQPNKPKDDESRRDRAIRHKQALMKQLSAFLDVATPGEMEGLREQVVDEIVLALNS